MKILALESSCDESCAAILDTASGKLLANIVHSHVEATQKFGGIVPEVVSREHIKALPLAYLQALEKAKMTAREIDWIVVTSRPGLIGSLLVGVSFAKGLAYALKKPYSTLDHIEAHLYSALLEKAPPFPWIALVVSGGHTELFLVKSETEFEWLGGTLDDAAGEAFDKIGKLLGMGYPAGPAIDKIVKNTKFEEGEPLSFPVARTEGYHFSFSGLKTSVSQYMKKKGIVNIPSVARATQEAILDALITKIELAQKNFGVSQVVVSGGVACNHRLRERLPQAFFPSPRYCSDNASMVALLGWLKWKNGKLAEAPWNEAPSPASSVL